MKFFEDVADSGVWWELWEAELALVGRSEDGSVRYFCSNPICCWCQVGDWAVDGEVVSCGATV